LVSSIGLVSASEGIFSKSLNFIKINTQDTWEKGKIILNFVSDTSKEPLGFGVGGFFSFFSYFVIGFFAGVLLWLFYTFIIRFYWLANGIRNRMNPYKEIKGRWIEFVAGRLWRVFVIGFVYAMLMQIPILNRILQFITLDFFITGNWVFILKSVFLAFEIGFIPTMFEHYYLKVKPAVNFQKELDRDMRLRASVPNS